MGTSEVADNSLTANDLAANSVGNSELAPDLTLFGSTGINYWNPGVSLSVKADPNDSHLVLALDIFGSVKWFVSTLGQSFAVGGHFTGSDLRLKQDVAPINGVLDNVMKLKPVSYRLKSNLDQGNQIGFIAQEVDKIFPELVLTNPLDDMMSLNYSGFGVLAIGAIQELNEKVETLEEEKNTLLQRLDALESRVQSLER